MAGFFNGSIMNADNVDFSGGYPPTNAITADGQLLIGSTAAPNIRPGSLTTANGTMAVTVGSGTIDIAASTNFEATGMHGWNGSIVGNPAVTVTSDGATITLAVQESGGGDLVVVFSDGYYAWDTTPADTVTLTAGSDSSPQINYIYFLQSTKTLTVSTVGFPATEYAPIATVICQSAASLQTQGAYKVQAWTDHVTSSSDQGHIGDLNFWIREQAATWSSGVLQTYNITTNVGTPDDVLLTTAAGVVLQLHTHTFPAFGGTPDYYVINDSVTPYTVVTDLNALLTDSSGGSMSGRYFSLVLWGVVSEDTADCKLFINLPSGSYNNQASLEADLSEFADYTIPTDYRGTGFLISEWKLRHQVASGGTWTSIDEIDLRGLVPSNAAGGVTAFPSEFADNVFRIFDDGDDTKKIAFQASPITTATTRTITMVDADIDMANVVTSAPTDSGTATPTANALTFTGAGGITTSASGTTVTITGAAAGGQPITDYVVDPSGGGSYTTIQAAVTQANTDGGGSVWIRPGSYTEDLTLYSGVDLVGACADSALSGDTVTITGTHTIPTSGTLEIRNVIFGDNTASVVSTATAGTTDITFTDCTYDIASGSYYLLDITNWTGTVTFERMLFPAGNGGRHVQMTAAAGTFIMRNCTDLSLSTTPGQSVLGCEVNISDCTWANLVFTGSTGSLVATNCDFYRLVCAGADVECRNCYFGIGMGATGGTGNFYHCTFLNDFTTPVSLDGSLSAGTHTFVECNFVTGTFATSSSALTARLITNAPTVNLFGCTLKPGVSSTYAINAIAGGATVNISGCDFVNSSAIENGITTNFTGGIKGGGMGWLDVTGTSATMESSFGYVSNNAALVTLTLPTIAKVGDTMKVTGLGAGGWRVAQNAGQSINVGAATTTVGVTGRIDSTNAADGVELICVDEDTVWNVIGFVGTIIVT